jgi:hypothetical protein
LPSKAETARSKRRLRRLARGLGSDRRARSPSNDYDGYVGEVYRLLANGANGRPVGAHLAQLERLSTGLFLTTHVPIDRCSCTTVLLSGSTSEPPNSRVTSSNRSWSTRKRVAPSGIT